MSGDHRHSDVSSKRCRLDKTSAGDVKGRIPVRRLGKPEDVASAVAFLMSDEAGFINGTSIVLDGGTMAFPPW